MLTFSCTNIIICCTESDPNCRNNSQINGGYRARLHKKNKLIRNNSNLRPWAQADAEAKKKKLSMIETTKIK